MVHVTLSSNFHEFAAPMPAVHVFPGDNDLLVDNADSRKQVELTLNFKESDFVFGDVVRSEQRRFARSRSRSACVYGPVHGVNGL